MREFRGGEEGARRWLGETGLPSRENSPSKNSRTAFHAHFINSNLSSAENWIRLIPAIDAALRSRILQHVDVRDALWSTASGKNIPAVLINLWLD